MNIPAVGATAFGVTSLILSISDVILFLTSGFSSVWVSVFTTASSAWACAGGVVATMVVVARIAQVSVFVLVFMAPFLLCSFVTVSRYQIVLLCGGVSGHFLVLLLCLRGSGCAVVRKVRKYSQLGGGLAYDWCVYCALLSRSFYV